MKKVIIAITTTAILGIPSSAMAWSWGAGAADLSASVSTAWPNWGWGSSSNTSKPKSPSPKKNLPKIPPVTPLIDILKKQLEETKKVHKSITGSNKFDLKKLTNTQTNNSSFFLKNPENIYNESNNSDISTSVANITQAENTLTSLQESRNAIDKRIQYATVVDKAVSLKTFREADYRFQRIEELLNEINTTKDLKSVAELQAHIIGMLAKIQNETTKLQMVSYSRNAEQALINQQKQKRNAKILNSNNKKMPTIRYMRST
ncbi:type IV secretion system protein VirB5 [Bartonella fuyuanensis]|uniref:Type IV secretion system protein VirB5 n=1 Tax=Bartonella fuyuanensis TaxID=1460968 RepID=A0A840DVT3_9HYPH|nr:type IV secretion system protein [Bartonella fuyuanensis]MBB4075783.1 type IV secretion system protein VirB5 [Bartonella fuyuanensis]